MADETATRSSKQMVKRWVTTWPYELPPTFGSSTIDWTKVEVVPAASYDFAQSEIERLTRELAEARELIAHAIGGDPQLAKVQAERDTLQRAEHVRALEAVEYEAEIKRLRAALSHYGEHHGSCTLGTDRGDGSCTCGFTELLVKQPAETPCRLQGCTRTEPHSHGPLDETTSCQHDLQDPVNTVTVWLDGGGATCNICRKQWRLSENGSAQ